MTSRLRVSRDYPHPVRAFAAALADPDFHRARLRVGGGSVDGGGEVVSHHAAGGRIEVTVRQPLPAGAVPAPIAALLAGAIVLSRTERWLLDGDRLLGAVEVTVPHAPVRAGGSMSVAPEGAGCRLVIEVDVTVDVPLAGLLVEPGVVAGIRALTGEEHERISQWLAAHP